MIEKRLLSLRKIKVFRMSEEQREEFTICEGFLEFFEAE
jgi:hypothetical protein